MNLQYEHAVGDCSMMHDHAVGTLLQEFAAVMQELAAVMQEVASSDAGT